MAFSCSCCSWLPAAQDVNKTWTKLWFLGWFSLQAYCFSLLRHVASCLLRKAPSLCLNKGKARDEEGEDIQGQRRMKVAPFVSEQGSQGRRSGSGGRGGQTAACMACRMTSVACLLFFAGALQLSVWLVVFK